MSALPYGQFSADNWATSASRGKTTMGSLTLPKGRAFCTRSTITSSGFIRLGIRLTSTTKKPHILNRAPLCRRPTILLRRLNYLDEYQRLRLGRPLLACSVHELCGAATCCVVEHSDVRGWPEAFQDDVGRRLCIDHPLSVEDASAVAMAVVRQDARQLSSKGGSNFKKSYIHSESFLSQDFDPPPAIIFDPGINGICAASG
ncbi:hypothetical protein GGX14DRAFT_406732 [Mycena pura]|uniref:Uncharacterized protein n=1 Tax=Mycena pura TaxID=153505 RepID=A0AAD6UQ61_9AGAR|nr:hypothetical protein GGX14DRAFT_406732 [Mycena pura]